MKGYIFDLDGTIYLGDKLIEGADRTIRILRERGDKILFLSNKPIATRQSYAEKLTKLGIPAEIDDVLNSSLILARYLQKKLPPGAPVYVIGEQPIVDELRLHGLSPSTTDGSHDCIVLSWDRQFDYEKLNKLYQGASRGAFIIASNPDTLCPLEDGELPDTGTFIAALESATGRPVDLIAGKPSPIAAAAAVEHLELDYADCYMIGDRLETDIRMANETGMQSVLVLTGVGTREAAEQGPFVPKHVLPSVADVIHLI